MALTMNTETLSAAHDRRAFDALVELGLGGGRITPHLATGLTTSLLRK